MARTISTETRRDLLQAGSGTVSRKSDDGVCLHPRAAITEGASAPHGAPALTLQNATYDEVRHW
jgi:hypothetical protein